MHQVQFDTSLYHILLGYRKCMEDPYTELTRAIIKLKEEIVELTAAILNLENHL